MSIKILHAADLHMDSPFEGLDPVRSAQRRREQRELFSTLPDLIKREGVQLVLLAGDLFDSGLCYYETSQSLPEVLEAMQVRVFIAPGNHDYYASSSPWSSISFPKNVTVFRSTAIQSVTLPDLGCRVWGAAFNAPRCGGLLGGFTAPKSKLIELMVLHGDITPGSPYGLVTEGEIAVSGLDYLALGHLHGYSGLRRSGNTFWAYPGCMEGRGFDETGRKGVILADVEKGSVDLRFVPMGGREYARREVSLTSETDVLSALSAAITPEDGRSILRLILTGEHAGRIDTAALAGELGERVFHLELRDNTREPRDLWDGIDDDSLRGIFLRRMRTRYDRAITEEEKRTVELAVRYALDALENREDVL